MKKIKLKTNHFKEVDGLFKIFKENGFELYIVGGAVRDYFLRNNFYDIDFATNATPDDIKNMFKKTNSIGERFGTVQVIFNNKTYEITTFREESGYSDNRHPDCLKFSKSLKEDIKRRDFTVNALALDGEGNLFDYYDGLIDLKNRIIRTVGDPAERFREDGLRKWRCIRLAAEKGFEIDPEVHKTITFDPDTSEISLERIKEELTKILLSEKVNWGGYLLVRTNLYPLLLRRLTPEILNRISDRQDLIESFEIMHLLKPLLSLRLAALLLPFNRDESVHFLKSLGFSKKIINETLKYLEAIDLSLNDGIINFKKRASIIGKENLLNLFELQDAIAIVENDRNKRANINKSKIYAQSIINESHPLTRLDLKINGNDLLNFGFKDKQIKEVLELLLNFVYFDPKLNEKSTLINLLNTKEVQNVINISK